MSDHPISPETEGVRAGPADSIPIIEWAAGTFGDGLAMSTSFGVQAAVMLHLATQVVPEIPDAKLRSVSFSGSTGCAPLPYSPPPVRLWGSGSGGERVLVGPARA